MRALSIEIVPEGPTGMPVIWCKVSDLDSGEVETVLDAHTFDLAKANLPAFVEQLTFLLLRHGPTEARAWAKAAHRRRSVGVGEQLHLA